MSRGPSGRIVIEVDPLLKRELYAELAKDGVTLKDWFIERARDHVRAAGQLHLFVAEPVAKYDGEK